MRRISRGASRVAGRVEGVDGVEASNEAAVAVVAASVRRGVCSIMAAARGACPH